jgi:hypothetical protein
MAKKRPLHKDAPYPGRHPATLPVCFTTDYETKAMLDSLCPHPRTLGATIRALVHAEVARREERARLKKQILAEPGEAPNDAAL